MGYPDVVTSPRAVDVAAILAAVYRRPNEQLDQLAERVRARLALIETMGECLRLLVEVPAAAASWTLGPAEEQEQKKEEEQRVEDQ